MSKKVVMVVSLQNNQSSDLERAIPGFLPEGSPPSVPASPPGCRSGGRGQGISDGHHTFQSLPGQKHRTSTQLSYHFNHGSSRTKSRRKQSARSQYSGDGGRSVLRPRLMFRPGSQGAKSGFAFFFFSSFSVGGNHWGLGKW